MPRAIPNFTPEHHREIVDLMLNSDCTIHEVARKYGCSTGPITAIYQKLTTREQRLAAQTRKCRLRKAGKTYKRSAASNAYDRPRGWVPSPVEIDWEAATIFVENIAASRGKKRMPESRREYAGGAR